MPPQECLILGLGWGLKICFSDMFPSDADAAGSGTTLRTTTLDIHWGLLLSQEQLQENNNSMKSQCNNGGVMRFS